MGCGASTQVSGPLQTSKAGGSKAGQKLTGSAQKGGSEAKYRELLGEDFIREFSQSRQGIRLKASRQAHEPRSPAAASATSAASTRRFSGTQISPYPLSTRRDAVPHEFPEPQRPSLQPQDVSGPFISAPDTRCPRKLPPLTVMESSASACAVGRSDAVESGASPPHCCLGELPAAAAQTKGDLRRAMHHQGQQCKLKELATADDHAREGGGQMTVQAH